MSRVNHCSILRFGPPRGPQRQSAAPSMGKRNTRFQQRTAMLKILYQLDDLDNIEANLMAEAANRLGVGEFQFFQLAYYSWFGRDLHAKLMERAFLEYMLQDKVPPWARQFARNIIRMDEEGRLNPGDASYHRFDQSLPGAAHTLRGVTTVIATLLFALVFIYLMLTGLDTEPSDTQRCYFPPCLLDDFEPPPPLP